MSAEQIARNIEKARKLVNGADWCRWRDHCTRCGRFGYDMNTPSWRDDYDLLVKDAEKGESVALLRLAKFRFMEGLG